MRPGVSYFSVGEDAVFAEVTGTFDPLYPVEYLADLFLPTCPCRVVPDAGDVAFTAALPAAQPVQMIALPQHTIPAGASVRARLYSDAGMTTLVTDGDLGPTQIPDPVTGWKQTFLAVMNAVQTVRAVRIDISDAGTDPIDLGGLEIAQWWEWPWITADANLGFTDGADDIDLLGGGAWGREEYRPNTYSGQVDYMEASEALTNGLDFLKNRQQSRPFVFCEDYSDPTTWPRTCFLAMNASLEPLVAQLYDKERFQFRAREWVR